MEALKLLKFKMNQHAVCWRVRGSHNQKLQRERDETFRGSQELAEWKILAQNSASGLALYPGRRHRDARSGSEMGVVGGWLM